MAEEQERIAASVLLENNVKRIVDENRREARGYRSLAQLSGAIGMSAPSLTHALKRKYLPDIQRAERYQISTPQGTHAQLHQDDSRRGVDAYGRMVEDGTG